MLKRFKKQVAASFIEAVFLAVIFVAFVAFIAVMAKDLLLGSDVTAGSRIVAALREPPPGLAFGSLALSANGSPGEVLSVVSDAEKERIEKSWQAWLDHLDFTIRSTPGEEDTQEGFVLNGMLFSGNLGANLVSVCNHVKNCPTEPNPEVINFLNKIAADNKGVAVYAALSKANPDGTFKFLEGTKVGLADLAAPTKDFGRYTPLPYPDEICGNNVVDTTEQCDDGNTVSGDGCSDICLNEAPVPVCGDLAVEGSEECDDGNTSDGDGCSATCMTEASPTPEATSTSTAEPSATSTAEPTETSTPEPTATATETATSSPTATGTSSPTRTATASHTATDEPTETPVPTNTPEPTNTPPSPTAEPTVPVPTVPVPTVSVPTVAVPTVAVPTAPAEPTTPMAPTVPSGGSTTPDPTSPAEPTTPAEEPTMPSEPTTGPDDPYDPY